VCVDVPHDLAKWRMAALGSKPFFNFLKTAKRLKSDGAAGRRTVDNLLINADCGIDIAQRFLRIDGILQELRQGLASRASPTFSCGDQ
jgi:hypothetical protein